MENVTVWNKLLDLLTVIIRAPYRSREDAERLEEKVAEIREDVMDHERDYIQSKTQRF